MTTLFGRATAIKCANWTICGSMWPVQSRPWTTTSVLSYPWLGYSVAVRRTIAALLFNPGRAICVWVFLVDSSIPRPGSIVKTITYMREEMQVGNHDSRVWNVCRKEVRSVFIICLKSMIDSVVLSWTLRSANGCQYGILQTEMWFFAF